MTAGLVMHWLESGRLELPLPASGRTAERWQRLAQLAEDDIAAARIAEAHVDAVAILHELGGKPPDPGQLWGVWAAESPDAVVTAADVNGGAVILNGTVTGPQPVRLPDLTSKLLARRGDDRRVRVVQPERAAFAAGRAAGLRWRRGHRPRHRHLAAHPRTSRHRRQPSTRRGQHSATRLSW